METTEQRIGPWRVVFEWDREVAQGNPSRLVIEPAPDAKPDEVVGGVSTTVLRAVQIRRPQAESPELVAAIAAVRALNGRGPSDPIYLATLARAYAEATAHLVPNPNGYLAERIGKSQNTVKAHIMKARQAGLLTSNPHRAGGELTARARRLVGELEG